MNSNVVKKILPLTLSLVILSSLFAFGLPTALAAAPSSIDTVLKWKSTE